MLCLDIMVGSQTWDLPMPQIQPWARTGNTFTYYDIAIVLLFGAFICCYCFKLSNIKLWQVVSFTCENKH